MLCVFECVCVFCVCWCVERVWSVWGELCVVCVFGGVVCLEVCVGALRECGVCVGGSCVLCVCVWECGRVYGVCVCLGLW